MRHITACLLLVAFAPVAAADIAALPQDPPGTSCDVDLRGGVYLVCDTGGAPCAVAEDPVCWSYRLACFFVKGPIDEVQEGLTSCETQPRQDAFHEAVPADAFEPQSEDDGVPRNCRNYGIEVMVGVEGNDCRPGDCANYGVRVHVVVHGHECGAQCPNSGVMVAAGNYCDEDGVLICAGRQCVQVEATRLAQDLRALGDTNDRASAVILAATPGDA